MCILNIRMTDTAYVNSIVEGKTVCIVIIDHTEVKGLISYFYCTVLLIIWLIWVTSYSMALGTTCTVVVHVAGRPWTYI